MRRGLRLALVATVVVAGAFLAAAGAFLAGVEASGEFLRAPLERALTAAFKVPTRIEGPIRLKTGLIAKISAEALVLADPSGPQGATLARGVRPGARIDLVALLRRTIALEEVSSERLELALVSHAEGRANWAPIFTSASGGGKASVSFAGIERLHIGSVSGSHQSEGGAPVRFAVTALDAALPLNEPMTARGSVQVFGQPAAFELQSASIASLAGSGAALPLQIRVEWSGLRASVDGSLARDGSGLDAQASASADDASVPLAALGIVANQAGRLEARMHVGISAKEALVRDLAVTLGGSVASGDASLAWDASGWRVEADIAGKRIDVGPFLSDESPSRDESAAASLLGLLERAATGLDARLRLAIGELAGVPVGVRDLELDVRSSGRVFDVTSEAAVSGVRVKTTASYDARKAQRSLAMRIAGGKASTDQLPRDARPSGYAGSLAGIHGQLRGQGANARAILASLHGDLEARDLRWSFARHGGAPFAGKFDLVRLAVQSGRSSSATVSGKLGGAACAVEVSGGALAPLLEGEAWRLTLRGSCPGELVSAKGHVALKRGRAVADLTFDAKSDRVGPAAQAFGVAPTTPHPIAARGTLVLDEKIARVRLDALRLGRSAGSGEVAFPLGAEGVPRVKLALASVDLNEIGEIGKGDPIPTDRLEREVLPQGTRLPDVDFEIAAERVLLTDTDLRRLRLDGAIRSQKMPAVRYQLELEGVPLSGHFGVDFSGAVPSVQVDGTANSADFRAWLTRFDHADIGLRAGLLSLRARAEGVRLGELLASATLDVALERGELELPRSVVPGLSRRGEFSATLEAAGGRSARLEAHGKLGDDPIDLSIDAPNLADIARAGKAMPMAVRLTLGDVRFGAEGKLTRDGAAQGRVQIAGGRLDRLGKLVGMQLPEVGPYSAEGNLAVSAGTVRANDIALSFGRSRAAGELQFEPRGSGRPRSLTKLRLQLPSLHLEDIGADRWIRGGGREDASAAKQAQTVRRGEAEIEHGPDLLRNADIDAMLDVDALHSAGERFASGRVHATTEAGDLRVQLLNVRTESGGVDADVRVESKGAQRKIGVRLRVENLDYGPLVRMVDPGSSMAGKLDLVADLAAQGSPGNLVPMLTGTVDTAVSPHGLYSAALGFWGTGIVQTMLRQLDPDSRSAVDCAVTSFDIDAGVAKSNAFFVDSTRVRVIGELEVDLTTRALSGRIRPKAVDPGLLKVAPTMVLGGTIDSVKVSIAPANVVSAPLRFAASLAEFPRDWLGAKGSAREPAQGCREAFEQMQKARAGVAQALSR